MTNYETAAAELVSPEYSELVEAHKKARGKAAGLAAQKRDLAVRMVREKATAATAREMEKLERDLGIAEEAAAGLQSQLQEQLDTHGAEACGRIEQRTRELREEIGTRAGEMRELIAEHRELLGAYKTLGENELPGWKARRVIVRTEIGRRSVRVDEVLAEMAEQVAAL